MQKQDVSVKISPDLYRRFRELFPFYGAMSWVVESALEEVVAIAEKDPRRVGGLVAEAVTNRISKLREDKLDNDRTNDPKQIGLFDGIG